MFAFEEYRVHNLPFGILQENVLSASHKLLYYPLQDKDAPETSVLNCPVPTLEPSRPSEEEERNRENERVKVKQK